jgi:hypothetical protein
MRVETAGRRIRDYVVSADDGTLMRHAFHILLAAAVVFVIVDWRETSNASADLPVYDPMAPDAVPVLPPALTEGAPQNAPAEISTDPDDLKKPIRFELQQGGVLLARGTIEPGAAARFQSEIDQRGEYVKVVSLDSPGGSVGDALAMSKLIRERKLGTEVATGALCASSCPIAMAGGVTRCGRQGRGDRRASGVQRQQGKDDRRARHVGGAAHHRRRDPPARQPRHQAGSLATRNGDGAGPAVLPERRRDEGICADDAGGRGSGGGEEGEVG